VFMKSIPAPQISLRDIKYLSSISDINALKAYSSLATYA
jgi:hypothetical protein